MTNSKQPDIRYIHLQEADSTSNYLSTFSSKHKVEEFTVVYADFQTEGKGQRGNSWESEPGMNLLFSIIMYPDFLEIRKQFLLSQIIALAIKEELDTISDGFSVKWPNDIYWHDKKICGILIENDLLGNRIEKSIAGIGININQKMFLSPAPNPVSLWQITGETYHISSLLDKIVHRIINGFTLLKEGEEKVLSSNYHDALFRKDGYYLYKDNSGEFMARILCVKPEGILILEDKIGDRREYVFKEVQYIL